VSGRVRRPYRLRRAVIGLLVAAGCGEVPPGDGTPVDRTTPDASAAEAGAAADLGTSPASDAAASDLGAPRPGLPDMGPPLADCHPLLDSLGLAWTIAEPTRGIADPVRVGPMIRGVRFRQGPSMTASPMLMDCSLAPRLVQLAELLATWDIEEVDHRGIYNYRCIGGGDPDSGTCTPSLHAYGRAIDLHAFHQRGTAVVYDTETDWVISTVEPKCPGMPVNDEDRMLHELACTLWSERIFQVVLTPDYNAAHRDHFHVDTKTGSMFLGREIRGVDPHVPGLGD
jgi:hypothetical protein